MTKLKENPLPPNVSRLRQYVKENIKTKLKFEDFPAEIDELFNILKRTITSGESDSVLVVGPRGCGKTHAVKECLREVSNSFNEEDYLVVYLNGLVHTDDSLALRAIIEQLHVDVLDGDQISGSFAERGNTQLIFSRGTALWRMNNYHFVDVLLDNLHFVLQSFKSGNKKSSLPILFILEEFQLFCSHRNQTLLYNLFDLSKSAEAPLCVLGVTCRNDITELLEKRVSSRFSHRIIYLLPNINLEERKSQFSKYLKIVKKAPLLRNVTQSYVNEWNGNVDKLLNTPNVVQRLQRQLEIDPSRRTFKNTMLNLICKVTETNPLITFENVEECFRKYYVDEKVEYLKDLSVLELCLIISMSHHVDIYDGEPFNFEMVIDKYLKFAKRNSAVQITQRPILIKAFERIKELEFIIPITASTRNQKKEYILYNLMVTKPQVKSAVYSYSGLPTDVVQWAFSNVA